MHRLSVLMLPAALLASGCLTKAGQAPTRSPLEGQPAVRSKVSWWRSSYVTSERRSARQAHRVHPTSASPPDAARHSARKRVLRAGPTRARGGAKLRQHRPPSLSAPAVPATPAAATGAGSSGPATVAAGARLPATRMIIYNARLFIRVFQLREAMDMAQKLAYATGGYLQSRHNHQLVIRVPVLRFHELVRQLEAIGEVSAKSLRSQDVTQRFLDLQVRLRAAEAVLGRLKALLAKAKNVEESLKIEKEMARIIEKIERFKGQLKFLRHHAALSTVTVYFQIRRRNSPPVQSSWKNPFHWVKGLGLWRVMRF